MTRKESLVAEAIKIENENRKLRGMQPVQYNEGSIYEEASTNTVAELQQRIKRASEELASIKRHKEVEAFYLTNEGKALKAHLEQDLEDLKTLKRIAHDDATKRLEAIAHAVGKDWGVCLDDDACEIGLLGRIGLIDEYTITFSSIDRFENGSVRFDIRIHYNANACLFFDDDFNQQMAFAAGLGKICGSDSVLCMLNKELNDWFEKSHTLSAQIREQRAAIENPLRAHDTEK